VDLSLQSLAKMIRHNQCIQGKESCPSPPSFEPSTSGKQYYISDPRHQPLRHLPNVNSRFELSMFGNHNIADVAFFLRKLPRFEFTFATSLSPLFLFTPSTFPLSVSPQPPLHVVNRKHNGPAHIAPLPPS
jgi:hypothetical protein